MKEPIIIYTDGACSGNPGPGGWAAVIIMDGQETELAGGEAHTTNQRMELKAAVEGLQHLSNPARVRLYSDSAYLVNAFRQGWMERWRNNGWLTKAKKPVENQDLWRQLLALTYMHQVEGQGKRPQQQPSTSAAIGWPAQPSKSLESNGANRAAIDCLMRWSESANESRRIAPVL